MVFLAASKNFFSSNCTELVRNVVFGLTLFLHLLSLDIRDEERADKVLDEHLRLVLPKLDLIDELIKSLCFKFGLVVSLER